MYADNLVRARGSIAREQQAMDHATQLTPPDLKVLKIYLNMHILLFHLSFIEVCTYVKFTLSTFQQCVYIIFVLYMARR
jgi:hypothetical protein